jgi:thymidylate kinase
VNKYVLAVEGIDGSGKTTVVKELAALCAARGIPFSLIGRRPDSAPPGVAAFTDLLRAHGSEFALETDLMVRIAREYQRAAAAAVATSGLVVLDRFVLSVLARARTEQLADIPVSQTLARAVHMARLDGTLFICCEFAHAWARITSGTSPLAFKETRGEAYNRAFAAQHEHVFRTSELAATRIEVENSGELSALLQNVSRAMRPILDKLSGA